MNWHQVESRSCFRSKEAADTKTRISIHALLQDNDQMTDEDDKMTLMIIVIDNSHDKAKTRTMLVTMISLRMMVMVMT